MIGRKKKDETDEESPSVDETTDRPCPSMSEEDTDETQANLITQRDEAVDRYQRTLADFRNYQRRSVQNEINAAERAKQDLIRELVPVLDNFDLAIEHAEEGDEQSVEAVLKGVRMVRDILMQTLIQKGLVKIQPERGDPFDPNCQEAMMMEATDEIKPNHIVSSMQVGYRMGDTVLRPAKVIIAKEIANEARQDSSHDSPDDNQRNAEP